MISRSASTLDGRVAVCSGAPQLMASPCQSTGSVGAGADFDRHADQRAVLGPGAVVVLHVAVAEQLVQGEPGVRGALTDAAVGDRRLRVVDAGVLVQLPKLLVAAEGAVLVGRLAPR